MSRFICVHGHFYQPPRENPWLEEVEQEESAYPYHDWNQRITEECYAPMAASRILDDQGHILRIVNNYSRISFNVGPTLMSWLERESREVYEAVLEADQSGRKNYSGHGNALAQPYNHPILPLASLRDKRTQVRWGLYDFERRFGRPAEGMWLPEAAVDLETLEVLAECGVRFTLLAPHQARRVRVLGSGDWRDVSGSQVDSTQPYVLRLPSGREIVLFFYHGPAARAVAFEGALSQGESLAGKLLGIFSGEAGRAQLAHIATDGETYGHHHRFGDMALSYALHYVESRGLARLTNYGEFLERHPPTHEAELFESTSWSCAHGVERWRSHCGCSGGTHPQWNQAWRTPLRQALDFLRDAAAGPYEEAGRGLFRDPWQARDDYIRLLLDGSPEARRDFWLRHSGRPLEGEEQVRALKLLELQRHALLMYTSCGWFFDDISGIETVQVLRYAGKALQIAEELFPDRLEENFLGLLGRAKSNVPECADGRRVFEEKVGPLRLDLLRVAAHYGASSLFESYGASTGLYCYDVERDGYRLLHAGKAKLAYARARIICRATQESRSVVFTSLHLGGHQVSVGVGELPEEEFRAWVQQAVSLFQQADWAELIRSLGRRFEPRVYSLKHLFRKEQSKILRLLLGSAVAEAQAAYRRIYEDNAGLMRLWVELSYPLPSGFKAAAELALGDSLSKALEARELDPERVAGLLEEAGRLGVCVDREGLGYALQGVLELRMRQWLERPEDLVSLRRLEEAVRLARAWPVEVKLWRIQNAYYACMRKAYGARKERAAGGDVQARDWLGSFIDLGRQLSVRVE